MPDVPYSAGEQLRSYGLPAAPLPEQERYNEEHALHNRLWLPIIFYHSTPKGLFREKKKKKKNHRWSKSLNNAITSTFYLIVLYYLI